MTITPHQAYAAVRDAAALRGEFADILVALGLVAVMLVAALAADHLAMANAGPQPDGWFAAATLGVLALSGLVLIWIGLT